MIIWNNIKKEHYIRINGKILVHLKAIDFSFDKEKEVDEIAIKIKMDNKVNLENYHLYCHIFTKPTLLSPAKKLDYLLWLGPIGIEPKILPGCKNWWERVINDKNIR